MTIYDLCKCEFCKEDRKLKLDEEQKDEMDSLNMLNLLGSRIKYCHKQLLNSRAHPPAKVLFIEGFRCRLDEMILYYHLVRDISFCEACKELDINYEDVNVSGGDDEK